MSDLLKRAVAVFGAEMVRAVDSLATRSLADDPVSGWSKRRKKRWLAKVPSGLRARLRAWRLRFKEQRELLPCKGFGGMYWCKSWDCPICRRRKMGRLISMAIDGNPTHFVTLTHPTGADVTPEAVEQRLQHWLRFLRKGRKRRIPGTNEWEFDREPMGEVEYWGCVQLGQRTGMVHLHLLMRLPGPLRLPGDVQEWVRLGGGIMNEVYHLPTQAARNAPLTIRGGSGDWVAENVRQVARYIARYAAREAGGGSGWEGNGYRASRNWLGMTVEDWDRKKLEAWKAARAPIPRPAPNPLQCSQCGTETTSWAVASPALGVCVCRECSGAADKERMLTHRGRKVMEQHHTLQAMRRKRKKQNAAGQATLFGSRGEGWGVVGPDRGRDAPSSSVYVPGGVASAGAVRCGDKLPQAPGNDSKRDG